MSAGALLAAWMFDQIPWNPWVFLPIPIVPAVGIVLLTGALILAVQKSDTPPYGFYEDCAMAMGTAGVLFLFVPLVQMGVMFGVNNKLEHNASQRATRDSCFEVMDNIAEQVGPTEGLGGHAGLMMVFLETPEGDPRTDAARQAMDEQGCSPSEIGAHLDRWEKRNAESALEEERQREAAAKREAFDSLGGAEAILEAVRP